MGYSAEVSNRQCQKLGKLLFELRLQTENFLNPHLFPPKDADAEDVARFFFFVTGIDHRTSPSGQSFEGTIDRNYFQGADLLWHLSLRRFNEDVQVFHPKRMAKITTKEVREWFTVTKPKTVTIRNPAQRAALLRDGGKRLMQQYQGSVLNLLQAARHRISTSSAREPGLLQLLAKFQAYEDPVSKKSLLLLKFLLRRNLWSHTDVDELRIPVDNHLTRIALRTGIVVVSPALADLLRSQKAMALKQDIALRNTIGKAYLRVSTASNRSVLDLDDFFWHFGRQCCQLTAPVCVRGCRTDCFVSKYLINSGCPQKCPLSSVCLAFDDDAQRGLVEPKVETWFY